MLSRIQTLLADLYDLPPVADVECFVCGPELLAQLAGEGAARRREVLLVVEDKAGVHVALYLDPEVLEQLRVERPRFEAVQLATEGVSHFLYLSFREQNAEAVSQLELELQAEVDKYAAGLLGLSREQTLHSAACAPPSRRCHNPEIALLLREPVALRGRRTGALGATGLFSGNPLAGNGVGAIKARSRALRQKLYAEATFLDAPDTEEGERYRLAHRAAGRYAARLEARFVDHGRLEELFVELRQFYRLGARQKLVRTNH